MAVAVAPYTSMEKPHSTMALLITVERLLTAPVARITVEINGAASGQLPAESRRLFKRCIGQSTRRQRTAREWTTTASDYTASGSTARDYSASEPTTTCGPRPPGGRRPITIR